jgi:hypothetical protein
MRGENVWNVAVFAVVALLKATTYSWRVLRSTRLVA